MIAQIARRTFSSRSAIRAPPAPSSTFAAQAAAGPSQAMGRVAMMPKFPSETRTAPSNASTYATSTPLVPQEELFQVGSVSAQGDATKVSRIGEAN